MIQITVLKGETDFMTITLIVILVILLVETFKTDFIVYIGNITTRLVSQWPLIFSIRANTLILTITRQNQREDVKIIFAISDNKIFLHFETQSSYTFSWWARKITINDL